VDLSGIIFVAVAIGWAVYLLPLALKRHDGEQLRRPVEEFSDKLRVLGRGRAQAPQAPELAAPVEVAAARAPQGPVTGAAKGAARRRRRVLALLLTTLVAVSVASYLGYTSPYAIAIPAALVVAFLVVARLTVRAQQLRRVAPVQQAAPSRQQSVEIDAAPDVAPEVRDATEVEPDLGTEDTQGLSREALADAVAAPVLDEGGLWDPLPVTLPTYVTKPRARRTVRTIELTTGTTGVTSSGHDAADTALAAEAAAAEKEIAADDVVDTPKAAGA
jgi:hypothetical protein